MKQPFLPVLPVIARYPFVRATGKFLEREYGSLSKILESRRTVEREAMERAFETVRSVIEKEVSDGEYEEWIGPDMLCFECEEKSCFDCYYLKKLDFSCEMCCRCFENCVKADPSYKDMVKKAKQSAVYYLAVKAILNSLSPWARRKFAVFEARKYRKKLEEDYREGRYNALNFIASDIGLKANFEECKVHVSSYLKGAVKIRDDKWRLVNRRINGGWVELTGLEIIRLMEEVLREKLEEPVNVPLPSFLADRVRELNVRSDAERVDVNLPVRLDCIPPCMKKILSDLRKGVNIPHTARFAITAFLLNIGMDVDSIVELFSSAPDFDEEKTRYQVEHIAGMRGKGSEYICPSCETMRTYHNCCADCKVSSPLTYYARRVKLATAKNKRNA